MSSSGNSNEPLQGEFRRGALTQFGPETLARAAEVEWLTEPGDQLLLRWPDDQGSWLLQIDLAKANGRTMVIGLQIRSFVDGLDENGKLVRAPGPWGLAEVSHPVIRALRMGQIGESARRILAIQQAIEGALGHKPDEAAVTDALQRDVLPLFNRDGDGKRRSPAGDAELEHIAELYRAALATEPRRPAKYVEDRLRENGAELDGPAVRKLIARARTRGLLPTATPRRPG